jgi:hypothetical protein
MRSAIVVSVGNINDGGNMTTTADQLAQGVGATVVPAKGYSRIVFGGRTLVYVNKGFLDFRSSDVAKAPSGARAKLTTKGNRATLPISETRAAATLLKHVAGQS